ncbi:hypothetical protein GCM10012275_45960 [Longimycelium tulufanense]|uniref:Uncharacterized protein n=1 Tax=Longimycelium tulufanense TaxID=907463 RepID=A0A8J3CI47_9PSEU|nr:hypothetical protein [Longimycelium tulufanense]GGM70386.1 hypothetical protein GCM10012275_45960 [Longimycelium tulufanense]
MTGRSEDPDNARGDSGALSETELAALAALGDETGDEVLTRLKDSAERWRNGLGGMTGLVGAALVFKGPDPVQGLPLWGKLLLLATTLLTLAAGVVGAFWAMRAASGPIRMTKRGFDPIQRLQQRTQRRKRVGTLVRRATVSALIMIVALVTTVVLGWFLPRGNSSRSARVELADGGVLCGQLERLDQNTVELTVAGNRQTLARTQVRVVAEVIACS